MKNTKKIISSIILGIIVLCMTSNVFAEVESSEDIRGVQSIYRTSELSKLEEFANSLLNRHGVDESTKNEGINNIKKVWNHMYQSDTISAKVAIPFKEDGKTRTYLVNMKKNDDKTITVVHFVTDGYHGSGIIDEVGSTKASSSIDSDIYKPGKLEETDYKDAFDIAGRIISALTTTGIVVSVIMVIILGIRYMAGSVEQRSEYKKTMVPMLIGIILIFSSSTIVSIIYSIVSDI